jgi:predicted acyl esterase
MGGTIKSRSNGSEPVHKIVTENNLAMRTRDVVTLKADVYRPDASGKFPVLR